LDANTEPLVWDASPRRIVFIAYEGMRLLDLTGPLDAFAIANEMHDATAPAPYSLHVVSERGGMVTDLIGFGGRQRAARSA
jgi:transcriptional regulator GlxA family with amidase domain